LKAMTSTAFLLMLVVGLAAGEAPPGHPNFRPSRQQCWGWRGVGTCDFPGAEAVLDFDGKIGKNVRWRYDIPSQSHSQPVVMAGRVFTLADADLIAGTPDRLLCIDAETGKLRWSADLDHWSLMDGETRAKAKAAFDERCADLRAARAWEREVHDLRAKLRSDRAEQIEPPQTAGAAKDAAKIFNPDLEKATIAVFYKGEEHAALPKDPALKGEWQRLATVGRQRGFVSCGYDINWQAGGLFANMGLGPLLPTPRRTADCQLGLVKVAGESLVGTTFASPVTDGEHIYVQTAFGVVACYDLDGKRLWALHDAPTNSSFSVRNTAFVASPILADDLLVVCCGRVGSGRERQRLCAYEKHTGKKVWERAIWHHKFGGGAPVAVRLKHFDLLCTAPGWLFRLSDGKCLAGWPCEQDLGIGSGTAPLEPLVEGPPAIRNGDTTAVAAGNRLYVVNDANGPVPKVRGRKIQGIWAVELTSTAPDKVDWKLLWYDDKYESVSGNGNTKSYTGLCIQSPRSLAVRGNRVYCLRGYKDLRVYDADTGAIVHKVELPPIDYPKTRLGYDFEFAGGPMLTARHLVHSTPSGNFLFFSLDGEPKLVGQARLYTRWELAGERWNDDPRYAGQPYSGYFGHGFAVPCGRRMYVRSVDALWCVGSE